MTETDRTRRIKDLTRRLGFDRVGIAPARPPARAGYYRQWLSDGYAGRMDYLHRHVERRTDPRVLLPGAESVIVVAHNYHLPAPPKPDAGPPRGRVARYAWGADYHRLIKKKLLVMVDRMRESFDENFEAKPCVDTAPVLERELAAAAGVGWIGKNTMLLDRELGSHFFLGEVITTLELAIDEPVADRCGTCTRCLDACPTGALHAPYQMDASRCVSYLTIELRDDVPEALKPKMGDWVFGCDACQEVCPYNRDVPMTSEPNYAIRPPAPFPVLQEMRAWDREDYRDNLRGSAMKRATLPMLHRNAKIALKNVATS